MSGLNEIIQWVQSEIILDPAQSVNEQYADIAEFFKEDNRSPLDDILLNDKAEFLKFLESGEGIEFESETEEEIGELEQRVGAVESGLSELFTEFGQIIRSAESVVLPVGFTIQTEVIEPVGFVLNDSLQGIVNFFKRLFR